jgi:Bifunctional DNA primase/polymerase, N-terminal
MTEPSRKPKERANERAKTIAREYLKRGWKPVPIGTGRKAPNDKDWQNNPTTEENLARKFSVGYGNIGVQFGKVSNGLTDIDLDCVEALKLADVFLPETKAVFGRQSKPKSHRLYVTDIADTETVATIQYAEPPGLSRDPKNAMLVELRIGGGGKRQKRVCKGGCDAEGKMAGKPLILLGYRGCRG